jgi:hypothetical protein
MDLETGAKLEFVEPALESIKRSFRPVTLEEHARAVAKAPEVVVRQVSPEGALG